LSTVRLVDIVGLLVGHFTHPGRPTGCGVVLCGPDGAVCGVDQRGGAPGTRETDLLLAAAAIERGAWTPRELAFAYMPRRFGYRLSPQRDGRGPA